MKLIKGIPEGYKAYQARAWWGRLGGRYKAHEILIFKGATRAKPGNEMAVAENAAAAIEYLECLVALGAHPQASPGVVEDAEPCATAGVTKGNDRSPAATAALSQQLKEALSTIEGQNAKIQELSRKLLQTDLVNEEKAADAENAQTLLKEYSDELEAMAMQLNDLQADYIASMLSSLEKDQQIEELSGQLSERLSQRRPASPASTASPFAAGGAAAGGAAAGMAAAGMAAAGATDDSLASRSDFGPAPAGQLVRTTSGTVRLIHEFPEVKRRDRIRWSLARARTFGFWVIFAAAVIYVFLTVSIFQTMRLDGIDILPYSAAVFSKIKALFGF
ncbi:MAG: hypothetical protein FWF30_03085 [Coriobacteriia bacterium]|nr:hypothetical protein [Coriobacteriia bacterium]